jgi:predicted transcriptional regulator
MKVRISGGAFSRLTDMLERISHEIDLSARHIGVLKAVVAHQPIGIMKLSELLDLPFHRIRYSLRILEQMGYIRASPSGAVATEKAQNLLLSLNTELEGLIGMLQAMRDKENS